MIALLAKDPDDDADPTHGQVTPPSREADDIQERFHKIEVPDFEDEDLIIKGR